MKLPYGLMDFKEIILGDYLYIDKTKYLEILEECGDKYNFIVRPRRFGKSLFLSLLKYYYDELYSKDFTSLFNKLYIGKNPTVLKNSFLVLSLDFSGLDTDSKAAFKESFRWCLLHHITDFFYEHESVFTFISIDSCITELKTLHDIKAIIDFFLIQVKRTGRILFLLIDEYDHFANDILAMGDNSYYTELIRARGFVRDFYETVKSGAKSVIDRIFITGISPVMLDDLTSGYNISSNITTDFRFNEMFGFTETEVQLILTLTGLKEKVRICELRNYYNGYLFSADSDLKVYNPDMVLYYLKSWSLKQTAPPCLLMKM